MQRLCLADPLFETTSFSKTGERCMSTQLLQLLLLGVATIAPPYASAQTVSNAFPTAPVRTSTMGVYRGFNAYESFRGLVTSSGALLKLDSSLGYDFNRNFGIFA